jgi:TonB family protein
VKVNPALVTCRLLAVLLLVAAPVRAQQVTVAAARELYAAAEYEGALAMLEGLLQVAGLPSEDRQTVELYRTLCLMAVGKTAEAAQAIDTMVARDPLYRPAADDIPPRVRTALTDARKRLLPSIIQQKYVVAKAAFDQKDFTAAAAGFTQVLRGLADPDIALAAAESPLSDLGLLAAGFSDLTAKAAAPPPAPPPAAEPPPTPGPAPKPVKMPEPVALPEPRIYGPEDGNVVPPIAIRQEIPAFPGRVFLTGASVLEVIVLPDGSVDSAALERPLNPQYDRLVLTAARTWAYQPATLNGVPVKYRKRIQIRLNVNR